MWMGDVDGSAASCELPTLCLVFGLGQDAVAAQCVDRVQQLLDLDVTRTRVGQRTVERTRGRNVGLGQHASASARSAPTLTGSIPEQDRNHTRTATTPEPQPHPNRPGENWNTLGPAPEQHRTRGPMSTDSAPYQHWLTIEPASSRRRAGDPVVGRRRNGQPGPAARGSRAAFAPRTWRGGTQIGNRCGGTQIGNLRGGMRARGLAWRDADQRPNAPEHRGPQWPEWPQCSQ